MTGKGKNLVIIDDDVVLSSFIGEMLGAAGFSTLCFENITGAYEYIAECGSAGKGIDIILLDFKIEDATVEGFAARIREQQPGAAVIIMSGTGLDEEKALITELLNKKIADDYLVKPFLFNELWQLIKKHTAV